MTENQTKTNRMARIYLIGSFSIQNCQFTLLLLHFAIFIKFFHLISIYRSWLSWNVTDVTDQTSKSSFSKSHQTRSQQSVGKRAHTSFTCIEVSVLCSSNFRWIFAEFLSLFAFVLAIEIQLVEIITISMCHMKNKRLSVRPSEIKSQKLFRM